MAPRCRGGHVLPELPRPAPASTFHRQHHHQRARHTCSRRAASRLPLPCDRCVFNTPSFFQSIPPPARGVSHLPRFPAAAGRVDAAMRPCGQLPPPTSLLPPSPLPAWGPPSPPSGWPKSTPPSRAAKACAGWDDSRLRTPSRNWQTLPRSAPGRPSPAPAPRSVRGPTPRHAPARPRLRVTRGAGTAAC